MDNFNKKALLDLKEVCEYTGFGVSKARSLINNPKSTYTIRCGNKLYVHKKLLDDYLEKCAKFQLKI